MSVLGLPCCDLSLVVVSWSYFSLVCELLIMVASLVAEYRLRCAGFSSCCSWAQKLQLSGSRVWAQLLWHMGFIAP